VVNHLAALSLHESMGGKPPRCVSRWMVNHLATLSLCESVGGKHW